MSTDNKRCAWQGKREEVVAHVRVAHPGGRNSQRYDTLYNKRKLLINQLIATECNLSLIRPEVTSWDCHAPWQAWVLDIAQNSDIGTSDPGVTVFGMFDNTNLA